MERDLPLLGICRGMQVMNVARGGTLVQDLPEHVGHENHRRSLGTFEGNDHPVRLGEQSLAAAAAGETEHPTLSHHHQGVDRVGDGFEVTGWSDDDDVPEALEDPPAAVRARRPVASGGRSGLERDRGARRGGAAKVTDVAVIGGGVVGTAVTLALARRGVDTVLLEARDELAGAASGTNSGILHTGFDPTMDELETRLILRSAELRDEVVDTLGIPVRRCGALVRGVEATNGVPARSGAPTARWRSPARRSPTRSATRTRWPPRPRPTAPRSARAPRERAGDDDARPR